MNMYKSLKTIALFLILLTSSCSEQDIDSSILENTQVSGKITSDSVWTLDKSPYIVFDDVIVERDVTLTIKPQVEIRFNQDKGLIVKGILIADGSAEFTPSDKSELIKFTSNQSMPDMGDWHGIKFDNTNNDKSLISYSKIEYAKIGIDCYSSSPYISDSFIEFNHSGIKLEDSLKQFIGYCTISHNLKAIELSNSYPYINHNIISQNDTGIILGLNGKINYNNFEGNIGYSIISVKSNWRTLVVDATNNWWNTTKVEEIEKQVYHEADELYLIEVLYIPYAQTMILDAGPRIGFNRP